MDQAQMTAHMVDMAGSTLLETEMDVAALHATSIKYTAVNQQAGRNMRLHAWGTRFIAAPTTNGESIHSTTDFGKATESEMPQSSHNGNPEGSRAMTESLKPGRHASGSTTDKSAAE